MPLAKKLEDGTDIVVPIGDFGKGVLIVGDQNSGKTYALKKTVEHLAMAQSMRNIIIFDVLKVLTEELNTSNGHK